MTGRHHLEPARGVLTAEVVDTLPAPAQPATYPNHPGVAVTVHGPGSAGVIGVALIRLAVAVPIASAHGLAWLLAAVLAWARRAIPGEGDRVAVLGLLGLLSSIIVAGALVLAPWWSIAALLFLSAVAGAYRRTVGEGAR